MTQISPPIVFGLVFLSCYKVLFAKPPERYNTHSLWSSMHLTPVHITAQSYKAASLLLKHMLLLCLTCAVAFDFVPDLC